MIPQTLSIPTEEDEKQELLKKLEHHLNQYKSKESDIKNTFTSSLEDESFDNKLKETLLKNLHESFFVMFEDVYPIETLLEITSLKELSGPLLDFLKKENDSSNSTSAASLLMNIELSLENYIDVKSIIQFNTSKIRINPENLEKIGTSIKVCHETKDTLNTKFNENAENMTKEDLISLEHTLKQLYYRIFEGFYQDLNIAEMVEDQDMSLDYPGKPLEEYLKNKKEFKAKKELKTVIAGINTLLSRIYEAIKSK